jgi:hypothetical protein
MKKLILILVAGVCLLSLNTLLAQDEEIIRKEVDVPYVDPAAITIDGVMNEAEWGTAAEANLITASGYEIWAFYYGREGLAEPDYDELYGRMLWTKDTLYVFMHIDEIVNDSTDLFFPGKFQADQLFVSLSSRLSRDVNPSYDGNPWNAPEGPYYYFILGDQVTLNGGDTTFVDEQFRRCPGDSLVVFDPSQFVRSGISIDFENGVWDVELAIYNPHVNAQSCIGFNVGGSTGSEVAQAELEDAYAYYTWQPNVLDEPFTDPTGTGDPGFYNLANSDYWALLKFIGGPPEVIVRKEVTVPMVDPSAVVIDGVMEDIWTNAAQANLITSSGYEIWAFYYGREGLAEPDYDELYGRLLWSKDTLYVFMHVDEIVNDSTDLFFPGKFQADQLFVSLSSRLGRDVIPSYDGNPWNAPEGPYYFFILGDQVTLNGGDTTFVDEEFRGCPDDSLVVFDPSAFVRSAVSIDLENGVWNVELAIHNPNVNAQACLGFNVGGSTGSEQAQAELEDAYAYYTWQPNVLDEPFTDPTGTGDPGFYNLADATYWAVLNFSSENVTSVEIDEDPSTQPVRFSLGQNYPNPFNPSTTIRFDLARTGPVTLKVYNVLGQVVATLIDNQALSNGTYSVTWNAENLSSGMYVYKIEAGGVVESKKMTLLK